MQHIFRLRRVAFVLVCGVVGLQALACEVPSPNAPAEPIGEFPKWGVGFATPNAAPNSLLGAPGPAPSGDDKPANVGTGSGGVLPGNSNGGKTGDWSGGDPKSGQGVYATNCLKCHGAAGDGGNSPGVGMVPRLADPAWQDKITDAQIASTIAHGRGAMPSFMKSLTRDEVTGVIAYIRTLKK